MYATNRLLGFESLSPSFFGAQSPQIPVKPSPDVQKLLDTAAKLPKADQLTGVEIALDAAIASKDPAGARFAARELRNVLIALKRTNEVEPYMIGLQRRAQQATFSLMEAHVLVNLAITFESAKQFDKAIAAYEAAAKLFEAGGDKAGQSRAIGNMAQMLIENGKVEIAVTLIDRALSLAKASPDKFQYASLLLQKANIERTLFSSIFILEESIALIRELGDRDFLASALHDVALAYGHHHLYKEALGAHVEALKIHESVGAKSSIAVTLNSLGNVHLALNDTEKAQEHYRKSLSIWRTLDDKHNIAISLSNIANSYLDSQSSDKGLVLLEEALTIRKSIGDIPGVATSLSRIAYVHYSLKNYKRAVELYGEAVQTWKSLGYKPEIASELNNLSYAYRESREFDKELELLDEALSIYQELGNLKSISLQLSSIAECHFRRENLDKAIDIYFESLEVERKLGELTKQAAILRRLAQICRKLRNFDLEVNCMSLEIKLHEDMRNNILQAYRLVDLGEVYAEKYLYKEAERCYLAAMNITWDGKRIFIKCNAARLLGIIYLNQGELARAKEMLTSSLTQAEELEDSYALSLCLNSNAVYYNTIGDIERAMALNVRLLAINRANDYSEYIVSSLNNIANIHVATFDFEKAMTCYLEALAKIRSLGIQTSHLYVMTNLADLYVTVGRYSEAFSTLGECEQLLIDGDHLTDRVTVVGQKLYLQALFGTVDLTDNAVADFIKTVDKLPVTQEKITGHHRIGSIMLLLGDYTKANWHFALCDAYSQQLGIRVGTFRGLIGESLACNGDIRDALWHLEPFLRVARIDGVGNAMALARLGILYTSNRYHSLANETLKYALVSALRDRSPDDIAKVYSALADHALVMKDRDVAIIHLKRAIEARQVQRRGSIGLDDAMTASLSLKVAPDYRKLAGLLTDAGRLGEAMEVAELLKRSEAKVRGGDIASETPVDQGKVSTAEAAYRKAAEDLGNLGDRERFLSKVKYPSDNVKAEVAAMPAKLKVANKALTDALNRVIAQEKAAGSAAGRMRDTGAAQARLAATLKRLGPGYAAVTVLCLPDSIRFLISTPTSLTMKRVSVAEKSLVGQVKKLRDSLLDPTSDPLPSANALHTVLWAPIESELKRLGVKHVLLSLTGTARYVPFGALHNGTQYVAQGWGLSLYSPTVLEHIGDRTAKQWSVLAAGNSTERTVDDGIGSKLRFTSLPGVRAELSRVRQSVGAGPAPILDNEFTLATLKDGLAKQPSVVHLASHFQFDPRAESLSFLLTGQGEVLRASDTTVLTKDAFKGVDLLTLSACQTGTFSETADGMEVEGIASLMQRKGAGAVMSTLWPVADASTAAFMGTFYTLRAQDPRRTKAWCLREAQLRMIRGEVAPPGAPKVVATRGTTSIKVSTKGLRKDWSHPYHWAPFILQGNPL